jgi:hypothetical protein
LEKIPEMQEEESPATKRKQGKLVGEINEFLKVISQEAREEFFGESNNRQIWEIVNSSPNERASFSE